MPVSNSPDLSRILTERQHITEDLGIDIDRALASGALLPDDRALNQYFRHAGLGLGNLEGRIDFDNLDRAPSAFSGNPLDYQIFFGPDRGPLGNRPGRDFISSADLTNVERFRQMLGIREGAVFPEQVGVLNSPEEDGDEVPMATEPDSPEAEGPEDGHWTRYDGHAAEEAAPTGDTEVERGLDRLKAEQNASNQEVADLFQQMEEINRMKEAIEGEMSTLDPNNPEHAERLRQLEQELENLESSGGLTETEIMQAITQKQNEMNRLIGFFMKMYELYVQNVDAIIRRM